ncbi:DUF4861 family protein [Pedobacter sp. SAFR-022]|uniref:DUF4861 family protein n=1 Tax=Pedobacter sp. SAFR-022 TaxID=3436861 RepID=UPI003F8000DF
MKQQTEVSVTNALDFPRKEITSIKKEQLPTNLRKSGEQDIRVKDKRSGKLLPLQWVDNDQNGTVDELLFPSELNARSISKYIIFLGAELPVPVSKSSTYSRFVPERTDDYTWENDRVAFRVYGPDAQQRTEQNRENGTLSSGVDLWLKRTDQPIINKWYKGYLSDPSFYHTDRGEGYDPYHVGASRGVGGSGIWLDDSLHVSKNYISYKTIAVGPLRTVFELVYAPWSKYGLRETKRISLDLGSNFSKFEVMLQADQQIPNYTLGITLHKNEGEAQLNEQAGYFRHQELIDGVFLGEGIVLDPATIERAFAHQSKTPDQSNLLIVTRPAKQITYYAGFAWEKSGQVRSGADWDGMLSKQAQIVAHPLVVTIK